jgi:DNA-binding NarL/FixJ family response regulator
MPLRIVLADDHEMVRAGIRSAVQRESDMTIVGEAIDGRAALELVRTLDAGILIVDISMPGMNGIEAIRRIRGEKLRTKVVVFSMHSDRNFVAEALKAGASAYVLKSGPMKEMIAAIRAASQGETYLSPAISDGVGTYTRLALERESDLELPALTAREREVLQLLAEGKTNKEMASSLDLSVKTIESHRSQIMYKLNLRSVAELTKYAIRAGITSLD